MDFNKIIFKKIFNNHKSYLITLLQGVKSDNYYYKRVIVIPTNTYLKGTHVVSNNVFNVLSFPIICYKIIHTSVVTELTW